MREIMIPATNNAAIVGLHKEGKTVEISGYFEISVVDFFATVKVAKREVSVEVLKKALLDDNQMDIGQKKRWLEQRNKENGLDLVVQIWGEKAGYRNHREAKLFFEPPLKEHRSQRGGLDLITVRAKDLKEGLKQVIGDEE